MKRAAKKTRALTRRAAAMAAPPAPPPELTVAGEWDVTFRARRSADGRIELGLQADEQTVAQLLGGLLNNLIRRPAAAEVI